MADARLDPLRDARRRRVDRHLVESLARVVLRITRLAKRG